MDTEKHDKSFVATFLVVLGALVAFTITISIIASKISAEAHPDVGAMARMEERIKPVGQVFTDEKALLAAAPKAAARAPMTGKEIVMKVCGACHNSGILNAPKTGDKGAWASRGNLNQLVASAIKGKGTMPPRGGDPELTDPEIRAAVQELIK